MIRAVKLDVIQPRPQRGADAWYADGLHFTCSQCGNCCTGGPGYVWISDEEIGRLARFLKLSVAETMSRYCRRVGGRVSLKEHRNSSGLYDCVFLLEEKVMHRLPSGERVSQTRRVCTAYENRPLQCRTWPFWPENLASEKAWKIAGRKCHGMDTGRRWTIEEIERIKTATDWPDRPPTSGDQG